MTQSVAETRADRAEGFGLAVLVHVAIALRGVHERLLGGCVGPGGGSLFTARSGAGRAEQGTGLESGGVGRGVATAGRVTGQLGGDVRQGVVDVPGGRPALSGGIVIGRE